MVMGIDAGTQRLLMTSGLVFFFRGVLKGLVDFELVQTLQSLFLFFSLGPALLDAPHRTFNTWLASCYSSIRPSIY